MLVRHSRRRGRLILMVVLAATTVVTLGAWVLSRSTTSTGRVLFVPAILGAQPPGAVVLAMEDRDLAVALAVRSKAGHLLLVATVLGQDGRGATGLTVSFRLHTADHRPLDLQARSEDAAGYYAAETTTQARPTRVEITIAGDGAAHGPRSFVLSARWPPLPAARLLSRAEQAYAQLRTLVTRERLASDPVHELSSVYLAAAPNSLQITSNDGSETILIGTKRWDRSRNQPWQRSTQTPPVQAIRPFWVGRTQDATLLGSTTVHGRNSWIVSFAAPQLPAFFTIWIDKQTNRTLQLRMTAAAHFMRHQYGPFNTHLRIRPPQGR